MQSEITNSNKGTLGLLNSTGSIDPSSAVLASRFLRGSSVKAGGPEIKLKRFGGPNAAWRLLRRARAAREFEGKARAYPTRGSGSGAGARYRFGSIRCKICY